MKTIIYQPDCPISTINAAIIKQCVGDTKLLELVSSINTTRHTNVIGHITSNFNKVDHLFVDMSAFIDVPTELPSDMYKYLPATDYSDIDLIHVPLVRGYSVSTLLLLDGLLDKLYRDKEVMTMEEIAIIHHLYLTATDFLSKPFNENKPFTITINHNRYLDKLNKINFIQWYSKYKKGETTYPLTPEVESYLETLDKVKEIINKDIKKVLKVIIENEQYIVPIYSVDPFISYWVSRYILMTKTICINVFNTQNHETLYRIFQKKNTGIENNPILKTKNASIYLVKGN